MHVNPMKVNTASVFKTLLHFNINVKTAQLIRKDGLSYAYILIICDSYTENNSDMFIYTYYIL